MPSFATNGTLVATQTLTGSEFGILGQNGAILTGAGSGIIADGNNDIAIAGSIVTTGFGLNFSGSALELSVGTGGNILSTGSYGVLAQPTSDAHIVNNGVINTTGTTGIRFVYNGNGGVGADLELVNNGEISGIAAGLEVIPGTGFAEIINAGTIMGTGYGIFASANLSGLIVVYNSGTISGTTAAYGSATTSLVGNDHVFNSGLMEGVVLLNGGDDIYNGRYGIVTGEVEGGEGNDTLKGGEGDETLDGGDDNDYIMGRNGDDWIIGSAGNDTLRGNGGDDLIEGGGKGDEIHGGRGDDTLSGGGGADKFIFKRPAGNDLITDFQDGSDLIDLQDFNLQNYAELFNSGAVTNVAGGVEIDFSLVGGSGVLTIEGIVRADLSAADFIF